MNDVSIDNHTRQSIIDLNQKLLELQTEIATKLSKTGSEESEQKKHLQILANEIERALHSIEKVVSIVHTEQTNISTKQR